MPGEPLARIDLIRHGEPRGGVRVRGCVDDPLSERGWQQMRAAAAGRRDWDRVVSSPLRRCAAFAEELAGERGLAFELAPGLAEIDFGDWEGRAPGELWANDGVRVQGFFADPEACPPPNGEPFAAFRRRVLAAWSEIAAGAAGNALVVAHGGSIRVILGEVLQMPARALFRLEVPYACVSRLAVHAEGDARHVVVLSHAA